MKRLTLALALAPMLGCFPTLHEIQQSCAQRFEPQASKELYMHCVSTEADDVRSQQQQLANAIVEANKGFQQGFNRADCRTTCNLGTCYTACR